MKKLFLLALLLPLLFSTTGCMTAKFMAFAWKQGLEGGKGSRERINFPPPFEGLEKYTK